MSLPARILPRRAAFLLFVSLLDHSAPGQTCDDLSRLTVDLGQRVSLGEVAAIDPRTNLFEIPERGSQYLRVLVHVNKAPSCQWAIRVRDRNFRLMEIMHPEQFPQSGSRWSQRVPGDNLFVDVLPCEDAAAPEVEVKSYIKMPDKAINPYYSRQDRNRQADQDLYGVKPLLAWQKAVPQSLRRLGDTVGMMMGSYDHANWVCSGVLLTPNLFLTNWHCGGPPGLRAEVFWSPSIIADTIVDLAWDGSGISKEYAAVRCLARNEDLDHVLLELTSMNAAGRSEPVPIRRSGPAKGEEIVIIHHAEALTKRISQCLAGEVGLTGPRRLLGSVEFAHTCDTEHGSSGAPVFTKDGVLVGLHHAGFDIKNCREVDRINKAIGIDKILKDLEQKAHEAFTQLTVVE